MQRTRDGSQARAIIAQVLGMVNCIRCVGHWAVLIVGWVLCKLSAWTIIKPDHCLDVAGCFGRGMGIDELWERLNIRKPGRDGKPE
jgi:hypothetical protein